MNILILVIVIVSATAISLLVVVFHITLIIYYRQHSVCELAAPPDRCDSYGKQSP